MKNLFFSFKRTVPQRRKRLNVWFVLFTLFPLDKVTRTTLAADICMYKGAQLNEHNPDKDTHTQTHAPKQAGTRLCPSRAFRSTNTILSHFGVSHGLGDRQGCIINNWLGMCVRVCVCVYQSSSVCVRVRKSVRVQVKAEPSAADKPHQVSLLCLTRTQPLASGGEKPLIGKGRNTHTDTHTHLL